MLNESCCKQEFFNTTARKCDKGWNNDKEAVNFQPPAPYSSPNYLTIIHQLRKLTEKFEVWVNISRYLNNLSKLRNTIQVLADQIIRGFLARTLPVTFILARNCWLKRASRGTMPGIHYERKSDFLFI